MHRKRKSVLLLMTFVLLCGAYSAAAQVTNETMSLVSRGAAEVSRHGASLNLTTSDGKFDRRQFCARQKHPQNSRNASSVTEWKPSRTASFRLVCSEHRLTRSQSLNASILSSAPGRKGQTYLYWGKEDQLFQLPVSYWTEVGSWVNSPGYGDRTIEFSRPVVPRCLECHATYFEPRSGFV